METLTLLCVNTGSTSVRIRAFSGTDFERAPAAAHFSGANDLTAALDSIDLIPRAVVHRIVTGFSGEDAEQLSPPVRSRIEHHAPMAPLHVARALEALDRCTARWPKAVQIAAYDSAYFKDLPARAVTFAVPRAWRERFGIRKIGYHGFSHEYIARRAPQLLDKSVERLISVHLGGGASASAILRGCAVETTMGFTPLEGLIMETRVGSLDPGVVLHLIRRCGVDAAEVEHQLSNASGMVALAGTADMLAVEARRKDDPGAALAFELYCYAVSRAIAALAVPLHGIDVVAFTGAIGFGSAAVRETVTRDLTWLGSLAVLAIEPEEELMMARAAASLVPTP